MFDFVIDFKINVLSSCKNNLYNSSGWFKVVAIFGYLSEVLNAGELSLHQSKVHNITIKEPADCCKHVQRYKMFTGAKPLIEEAGLPLLTTPSVTELFSGKGSILSNTV